MGLNSADTEPLAVVAKACPFAGYRPTLGELIYSQNSTYVLPRQSFFASFYTVAVSIYLVAGCTLQARTIRYFLDKLSQKWLSTTTQWLAGMYRRTYVLTLHSFELVDCLSLRALRNYRGAFAKSARFSNSCWASRSVLSGEIECRTLATTAPVRLCFRKTLASDFANS